MNTAIRMAALGVAATIAMSTAAHAALQGRDLNGSAGSFEAYYDTDLDITWLADANYAQTSGYDANGAMTWADANTWAANLSIVDAVNNITYDNWRLPTLGPVNGTSFNYSVTYNGSSDLGYNITSPANEMSYMFYVNLGNPGLYTPTGVLSGCYVNSSDTCLNNVGPFANLQAGVYWSDTPDTGPVYAPSTDKTWVFRMNLGSQDGFTNTSEYQYYAWAVSPGDVAAVPEAQTYALMLAGLGLIGWRARRRG